ncbi:gamma-glutamylcyclotransferase [Stagnihabitans tardus]|uniref:glutathione-specific gamma-glutamylcyclotransferase n=1 Tax=Stagnihabitans tardus TaxID=2699202 RepID=A0AAE4Y8J5_9RHOB|nr:gamma-glutamylcyclotransferase [Stagnihabitans tardus]NBZ87152.1 gamma-glutamylcyclotransferase [Stagnihabitans tardus]
MEALWVFGYGSLIWNPGFPVAERRLARVEGYHRSFCMKSVHYRGTPERHGLVLALDALPGAVCHGLAMRAEPGQEEAVLAYLRDRELSGSGYEERHLPLQTDAGEVLGLTFVITPARPDYLRLALEAQARVIAQAVGERGPNRDYLFATAAHLAELGIPDPEMETLVQMVRAL